MTEFGSFETLQIERSDAAVVRLTLDRPEKRNALNWLMRLELSSFLRQVALDDSTRILVLAGADLSFCGDADLTDPTPTSTPTCCWNKYATS